MPTDDAVLPPPGPGRPRGVPWPPIVVIGVVTVVALVAILAQTVGGREPDGPRTVHDTAFVAAATQACTDALPALRPSPTEELGNVSPEVAAERVAKAADGLDALAQRLADLAVPGAAGAVQGWLDDWKAFTEAGRHYADVVRNGDVKSASKVARGGDPAQLRADRFARANGLGACQLQSAFLPNR